MPHFEIKLYLGYRPEQWKALFRRVVDAAIEELGVPGAQSPWRSMKLSRSIGRNVSTSP